MTSSQKYVGLTILRLTNINTTTTTTQFLRTVTASVKFLSINSPKLNTVTKRYYHQNISLDLNNRRETTLKQQQQITAFRLSSSLKPTVKQKIETRSLSSFHKYKDMDAPPGIFKGCLDRFNGVTVESSKEFNVDDNFPEKLKKSIAYWQEQKRRAIWFHITNEHSEWVPHLTKMNFQFHHAKNGILVLSRWLPEDEYPNLPVYAHTMLGVGGLVVNEKNEVLVVCERFSLIPNSWKLPGGYAEPHENIIDAAIREVREETGVETVFNTVISLRHSHSGVFGCSDIYCVVALIPTTLELQRCEREIAKTMWMPCEEYLQHPNVHETNRHFMRCFLDYKKRGIRFTCEKAQHQILKKDYCLYYMKPLEGGEEGTVETLNKL